MCVYVDEKPEARVRFRRVGATGAHAAYVIPQLKLRVLLRALLHRLTHHCRAIGTLHCQAKVAVEAGHHHRGRGIGLCCDSSAEGSQYYRHIRLGSSDQRKYNLS